MTRFRYTLALLVTLTFVSAVVVPAHSAPGTPAGFVAAPPTACGAIWLSWTPVAGVTGYNLYRNGVRLTSLFHSADRYYDYDMPGPGAYVYSIESFDPTGVSPPASSGSILAAPVVTVDPWDWFHDVFPSNGDPALPGTAAFARLTAKVRTGHNLAPLTGTPFRGDTPATNLVVHAAGATGVDIVYRIKPGPGNYKVVGLPAAGLLWSPAVPAGPVACPGDASYWGPDIDPPVCPGIGTWNPNKWITRACDAIGGGDFTTTKVGVRIFPDDLFTPGTVVEYYFVASYAAGPARSIPDPNCVMQVANQQSTDGHRWEQFTVLPDLWKDAAFGGLGLACALVVDLEDGRGNERIWAGMADSLAATHLAVRGGYNGWSAPANGANPVDLDSPANFVANPNAAAGTTWDLYSVRGWQFNALGNAGALGGRLGVVPAGSFPPGPTPAMIEAYYKIIVLLSGDRSANILGPVVDRSQDDIALLTGFLLGATVVSHRGILTTGNGFVTSEVANHAAFVNGMLQTDLRAPSYAVLSGNAATCAEMTPTAAITTNGDVYGVANPAAAANDVLDLFGPDAIPAGYYDPVGLGAPYIASVFKDAIAPDFWQTVIEGWNLRDLLGKSCGTSYGRLAYYYQVFTNPFAKICQVVGPGAITTAVANDHSSPARTQVLELRNNPMRDGAAEIHFTLAAPDRVEARIYDLAGRVVRVIPARAFDPGEHSLAWDGRDDAGRSVTRGIYFVRVRFAAVGLADARRIVILK